MNNFFYFFKIKMHNGLIIYYFSTLVFDIFAIPVGLF